MDEPSPPDDSLAQMYGVSASSMPAVKERLPIGVYVIAGLQLVGLITSIVQPTNDNLLTTLVLLFDLLLCVGLLFRLEVARKTAVVLGVITIALGALTITGIFALKSKVDNDIHKFDAAVSQVAPSLMTTTRKAQFAQARQTLVKQQNQADTALRRTLITDIITISISAGETIYLMLPKVKSAFRVLEA